MGIADLAERASVTPRTIRFYITEGLLPPPGGAGPHRVYTSDHLLRLQAIQRLKDAYLPLREIRRRLDGLSRGELQKLVAESIGGAAPLPPERGPGVSPSLPRSSPSPFSTPTVPQFLASLRPPARGLAEPRLGAAY